MGLLKALSAKLGQVLALYGGWGLLGISFLDSSFVPLPGVNDLLLIHLSSLHPNRALPYALQSTVGSVLGAMLIYGLARGGRQILRRGPPASKTGRVGRWLDRNDFLAVLVASLLPPPAPFKAFLLTAGALKVNPRRVVTGLMVGRAFRFGLAAMLAARYGLEAEAYLKRHLGWVSLLAAALAVLLTLLYRRFIAEPAPKAAPSPPASGADLR